MTPDDIEALFKFKGGHGMARVAAQPDLEITHWKQSMHGSCGREGRIDTERNGIRFESYQTGDVRFITWKAIKAHAVEHTSAEVRDWIRAFDWEWCRAYTGTPGFPPERAAVCRRWLEDLAHTVWDPALAAPPEPVQLSIFDALKAAP